MSDHRYTPLRYAHVGETDVAGGRPLPVEWVMLARWEFEAAEPHYCVEYVDAAGETAADDDCFGTEEEASRHTVRALRLAGPEWHDGVPPWASA